ncbi:MAG: ABC transporter permease [Halobacteriales archaeon]|nr:ABC transporter permease [Halobacteriales archaeon]
MAEPSVVGRLSRSRRVLVARRELAALKREKTIVLALLIQLFIAAFSSFLLVGLVSLYDPGAVAGSGIAIGVAGNASGLVVDTLDDEGAWRLVEYDGAEPAEAAFASGQVDALLLVDEEATGRLAVDAVAPDESVRSTVVVLELRSALEALERERRLALADRLERPPVPLPDVPSVPPTFGFTYTVLLPLLVFLPVFISGSIAADAITEELDAGTLELLRVSPLSAAEIVEGKMLAMVAIVPVQAGAWLLLLGLNGTAIARPLAILVLVTAAATIVVAIGSGLALALRDRQSAQLIYSLAVILLFVAASALPETPPNAVAKLAIGSHGPATLAMVAAYAAVAVAVVWAIRRVVVARVA